MHCSSMIYVRLRVCYCVCFLFTDVILLNNCDRISGNETDTIMG